MVAIINNIFSDIKYQLDTENKTAKVIGYQGEPIEVIFPEYIEYKNENYKVTTIEKQAFYFCDSLTSITIHDSITKIGPFAFYFCDSLTSITIHDSITKIGPFAFSLCENLTSVTIHGSVTFIGDGAFQNCHNLKTVIIPNSVTHIGDGAFFMCENLESITIPYTVTHIGDSVFCDCRSLTSVNILNSITEFGYNTFNNIGLTLPKKYTDDGKLIAYKAFYNDMTCRKFQYEEGKSYEIEGKIELCNRGFHACTNPLDIFNYYVGEIGKDIYIHEVYLSGTIDEDNKYDSKVCASKIEIGERLSIKDINEIINTTY